ncbi:ChrR family anti-sigma-E factor [Leisingera caerulea]|uniref:ChrR family anti-sigma-E factor n=1 Tax=Leisingera caerulea TaxID=506591 RepID=A0ABY5WUH0_LEICA|nr:ChrR family anti-sigma-E factor [Leisingera caerulea]UWQ49229.1 ChrR family anti-sigma-E factor [Leisingera caerulea]UWQ57947.1 ChrR family anti-sigma-E factor [Leisingera caerulea]
MPAITHHIPDPMIAAYASGSLPHAFSMVVASHLSYCRDCQAALGAHQAAGGALLEEAECVALEPALKSKVLAELDAPAVPDPVYDAKGIYPGAVMQSLKGRPPRWKTLGMGVKQDILFEDKHGSARLLFIPAGQAVPDHSHNGLELTLVLQGSFSDETGRFGVGDVEIGDEDLEHTPVADAGDPCICLAATDAPLRFKALMPRLLQPLFRI